MGVCERARVCVQGILFVSFRAFRLLRLLQPMLKMRVFRDAQQILETLAQAPTHTITHTRTHTVILIIPVTIMSLRDLCQLKCSI